MVFYTLRPNVGFCVGSRGRWDCSGWAVFNGGADRVDHTHLCLASPATAASVSLTQPQHITKTQNTKHPKHFHHSQLNTQTTTQPHPTQLHLPPHIIALLVHFFFLSLLVSYSDSSWLPLSTTPKRSSPPPPAALWPDGSAR